MEIAWSYDNLSVKNIRKAIEKKEIPTNRWVLLYLYKYPIGNEGNTTQELFNKYGADICNWLGMGIPLYTIFPRETFESWEESLEYGNFEEMKRRFEYSEHKAEGETKYSIMKQLGDEYGLGEQEYPALVVIDAKHKGFTNEIYAVIRFGDNSADMIFETIKKVIEAIRSDSNDTQKVFSVCNNDVKKSLSPILQKLKEAKRISLDNIMKVLLETHSEDVNYYYGSNELFLSSMETFSRASYYNYMNKDKIPFEVALEFALELRISTEEFEHLIDFTDATYIQKKKWIEGTDKRYEAIKYCMEKRMGFDCTNEYLEKCKYKIIKRSQGGLNNLKKCFFYKYNRR